MTWKQFFLASILTFIFNIVSFAQINDIPPPSLPDPTLLADIFQATDNLQYKQSSCKQNARDKSENI